jgi:hypothetical protein
MTIATVQVCDATHANIGQLPKGQAAVRAPTPAGTPGGRSRWT